MDNGDEAYEDYDGEWYPFEDGATMSRDGENGFVLRDEQLGWEDEPEDADARLTLEQGRADRPGFFVTATLYAWLFVTAKYAGQTEAEAAYEAMKEDLVRLAALIPYEEDGKRGEEKARALTEGVTAFERKFA